MLKILYTGTTQFSAFLLIKLIKKKYNINSVLTNNDKKKNRKQHVCYTQIKKIALLYNIEIHQPKKISTLYEKKLQKIKNKIIIVAAFNKLFPNSLLNLTIHKCYNIHPSLLPKYRGPSPIQETILNGEKQTGITIYKMDENFDTGPVIFKKKLNIEKTDNSLHLEKKLVKLGFFSIKKTLQKIKKKKTKLTQQSKKNYSKTKIIKKKDYHINWNQLAKKICNQIKAYQINKIAYTYLNKKKIKLYNACNTNIKSTKKPGTIEVLNKELYVHTITYLVKVNHIQIESKKKIKTIHLLNMNSKIIYNNAVLN